MKYLCSSVILALLIVGACDNRKNTIPPEEAAKKFATDLGMKLQGSPNCTGIDTDNDGYVTCTIAVVDRPEAAPRLMSIQCAGITANDGCNNQTAKYTTGCKETQLKIPTPTQGAQ